MSDGTDFDDAAKKNYDEIRGPFAVDDMIRCMKERSGKQLSQLHVLDVGCGTGNYSVALLEAGVGKVSLFEASQLHILDIGCGTGNHSLALLEAGVGKVSLFDASVGMLTVARKKMAKFDGQDRIGDIKQAVLPTVPFEGKTFDVVMINCVLHHLKVKNEHERSTAMTTVFRESARVLTENGLLLITTCYPEQLSGYWYANIAPEVTKRKSFRFRSRDVLIKLISESGFGEIDFTILLGPKWKKRYFEAEGPLSAEWRNFDSYWSLFTEEELQTALTRVLEMKAAGTLDQFMIDNDKSMSQGHFVLVKAVKQ